MTTTDTRAESEYAERDTNRILARHLEAAERAAFIYESKRSALYHSDGRPIYADTTDREAALLAELEQAITAAEAPAARMGREAEQALDCEENADPASRLSEAELSAVNARMELTREDCERLPVSTLAERLRLALAAGDRPAIFLMARYAGQRHDAEVRAGRATRPGVAELGEQLRAAGEVFRDRATAARARGELTAVRRFRAELDQRSGRRQRLVAQMVAEGKRSGAYSL